ncbi:hypothetical protein [Methylorubrum suomiense]|uniref:Uncharacterized protein n=1 Tax=Methylorubrum suomiense TaxID=144191 RepID=A0ABQ4V0G7_9HYPH|nr:hypothetical protein [Methylorubrum suomiense]GJE78091.1 hypothetical protein BGCPKDLD_4702 [Methylorubrum suomiense]
MAIPVFDFPFHTPNDEYPGGSTVKFGRGYRFAARPNGPDEIITHLRFETMFVYQTVAGGAVNQTVDPQLNIFALNKFYEDVGMWGPFTYNHHRAGAVRARFNKPLVMPKTAKAEPGKVGGKVVGGVSYRVHQVEPFDLDILWTRA